MKRWTHCGFLRIVNTLCKMMSWIDDEIPSKQDSGLCIETTLLQRKSHHFTLLFIHHSQHGAISSWNSIEATATAEKQKKKQTYTTGNCFIFSNWVKCLSFHWMQYDGNSLWWFAYEKLRLKMTFSKENLVIDSKREIFEMSIVSFFRIRVSKNSSYD